VLACKVRVKSVVYVVLHEFTDVYTNSWMKMLVKTTKISHG
jgi:hypothetical protein